MEAFKKFVSRSRQLSDYLKAATINFAKMTKKVKQLQSRKELIKHHEWEEKRSVLLEQIQTVKPISNKDWLVNVLG